MTNKSYIPSSDADKGLWLNNFNVKLPVHATILGITPAELTSVQHDNAMFQYVISIMEVYRQYLSNLTGYKNMLKHAVAQQHIGTMPVLPTLAAAPTNVPEGVFDRIGKLVMRIKSSTGYTDNIGSDLGIIAPTTSTVDVDGMQPDISIKLDVGRPHLKWVKGHSDALDLYVDRNDGTGFNLLGRLLKTEYIDVTNLDATKIFDEWKYKGIYVISDTQVGLYSKVTSVDVKKI